MTTDVVKLNGVGTHLALAGDLKAGFLQTGRNGERKSYGAFSLEGEGDGEVVIYRRPCTKKEKQVLRKLIFGLQSVRSQQRITKTGEPCMLFLRK